MQFPDSRRDTRRKRHGVLLGGHHGSRYSGNGKYMKQQYWRAERRYWKAIATAHYAESDESRLRLASLFLWRSEINYKGW